MYVMNVTSVKNACTHVLYLLIGFWVNYEYVDCILLSIQTSLLKNVFFSGYEFYEVFLLLLYA